VVVKRQPTDFKRRVEQLIKDLENAPVSKVGYFENAKYPDGTSVAEVAATHEFGRPEKGIPPRSTIRPTMKQEERNIATLCKSAFKKVVKGELTVYQVMDLLGQQLAGSIRKAIATITTPPLRPNTIRRRAAKYSTSTQRKKKTAVQQAASEKPLVDEKVLLNSTTSVVEKE